MACATLKLGQQALGRPSLQCDPYLRPADGKVLLNRCFCPVTRARVRARGIPGPGCCRLGLLQKVRGVLQRTAPAGLSEMSSCADTERSNADAFGGARLRRPLVDGEHRLVVSRSCPWDDGLCLKAMTWSLRARSSSDVPVCCCIRLLPAFACATLSLDVVSGW